MSNVKVKECPYCGSKAEIINQDMMYNFVTCPTCGRYEHMDFPQLIGVDMKDEISSYLYYKGKVEEHADYRYYNFIGDKDYFDKKSKTYPWCHHATLDEIKAFYPHTFSERITKILLGFAKQSQFFGDVIELTHEQTVSALFVKRYDKKGNALPHEKIVQQLGEIQKYFEENQYAEFGGFYDSVQVFLKPEGWKRIDFLQSNSDNNKNVFVSMAFNDMTKDTREAIRNGIIAAGYSPEFIDEIIHNKQIVPEMFRLIRECRFLILDISDPNYGAYYEAGYALGLGKEVIICCKAEIFGKNFDTEEERKYAKYLKPHFDIAQKQILVWEDYKDLTTKLKEWIKAIIQN